MSEFEGSQYRLTRKSLITSSLGAVAAISLRGGAVLAQGARARAGLSPAMEEALNTGIPPNDGLAHPIPYTPPLGSGQDRALVLGGGAFYLTAFYSGYFIALAANGVDLKLADIMVGTSAGTLGCYTILTDQVTRMKAEVEVIGNYPATLDYQVGATFSSIRADDVGKSLDSASVANVQQLGRAAMATQNAPVAQWQALLARLTGAGRAWPSPKFHTTAIDCYTAQRLVVGPQDDVPAVAAMSASSSWPGLAGPTWVKDRLCMDGGTCQTSTHSDVVAGAKRVLIVSLATGNAKVDEEEGLRLSKFDNTLLQEVKNLQSGGSKVMLVVFGVPPGYKKVNLVDPALIPVAVKYGSDRGNADAAKIKAFWT
jgi:NTE family protein